MRGLITILGERATMARAAAEEALDLAARQLGRSVVGSTSASTPLFGGTFGNFASLLAGVPASAGPARVRQSLARNYGDRYGDVLRVAEEDPRLLEPLGSSAVLGAEVAHAVRHEMALSLDDVVFRRTDLGVGPQPDPGSIEACAELMGAELEWTPQHRREQIESVLALLEGGGVVTGSRAPTQDRSVSL